MIITKKRRETTKGFIIKKGGKSQNGGIMKHKVLTLTVVILGMMVYSSFPASVLADTVCTYPVETQGEMLVHGYDEGGIFIQIYDSDDLIVWEGWIGVEPELISGFEPGAYTLVGPEDGKIFGAMDPAEISANIDN